MLQKTRACVHTVQLHRRKSDYQKKHETLFESEDRLDSVQALGPSWKEVINNNLLRNSARTQLCANRPPVGYQLCARNAAVCGHRV
jgi:hypothetical protein